MEISNEHISDVCTFSKRFGFKFAWKIDQNVSEYEGFESPEAHLCGSSGDLEIAYKPVSLGPPRVDGVKHPPLQQLFGRNRGVLLSV